VSPIIVISLLAGMSLGTAALADQAPSAGAEQYTQNCQTSNPRLEGLASAIERGDLNYVRSALDEGLDVNETWRDVPAQLCRSLLLWAVWHGRDDIFNLLLKSGADPRTVPDDALGIPVRTGRLDMARTLLGLGRKLPNKFEIVLDAIESGNMTMFDLVASAGVTIDASTVPAWALSDALTLHLVPKYFRPNDTLPNVGNGACTVQELFGLLSPEQDGCEGTGRTVVAPLRGHREHQDDGADDRERRRSVLVIRSLGQLEHAGVQRHGRGHQTEGQTDGRPAPARRRASGNLGQETGSDPRRPRSTWFRRLGVIG